VVQVASVAGGDASRRPLAEGSSSDTSPAWSPAGDWIAFTRFAPEATGVWIARPDGAEARPLQESRLASEFASYVAPVWRPDGGALAYTRVLRRPGAAEPDREVWVASPDGQPRRLGVSGDVVAWAP
jgi:TolB protein